MGFFLCVTLLTILRTKVKYVRIRISNRDRGKSFESVENNKNKRALYKAVNDGLITYNSVLTGYTSAWKSFQYLLCYTRRRFNVK